MLKIRLKRHIVSTLLGTLLVTPLGLIPVAANASTIALGEPGIYEMGGLRWDPRDDHNEFGIDTHGDVGGDGLTQFTVDFGTDEGTWLLMNASPADPNEQIKIQLLNRTFATINSLTLEFRTTTGQSLGAISDRPILDHWAATISDSSASVDVVGGSVENGDYYQRVNLVFSPVMPDTYGGQMLLDTGRLSARNAGFGCLGTCPPDDGNGTWLGFNPDGVDWYFNIDPNFVNLNGPPQPPAVPIPGAIWLLGSALLGLVARSGRKHAG